MWVTRSDIGDGKVTEVHRRMHDTPSADRQTVRLLPETLQQTVSNCSRSTPTDQLTWLGTVTFYIVSQKSIMPPSFCHNFNTYWLIFETLSLSHS